MLHLGKLMRSFRPPLTLRLANNRRFCGCVPLTAGRGLGDLCCARSCWQPNKFLDQHRIAQEIDEGTLSDIVRRFIAVRNACTPGRYEIGLRMYEDIPLGPVQGKLLK
jgi:hypothetical protein